MKYQSSNTRLIYDIDFTSKKSICPECSKLRRKDKLRDVQYYPNENTAYCFHCNTTYFEYKPYIKEKQYTVPEWKNITSLTDRAVKWFTSRMISQKSLNTMKVYSDKSWMPEPINKEIEVVCFPYFQDEKLINIKYRGDQKSFKLNSGSELIWYNFNSLISGNKEIIITEGEIDLLTWVENGYSNVISPPNGAKGKNLEYLDTSIDLFNNIETVYLGLDLDLPGIECRDELIRRIGHEKCRIISYLNCKDANEYFCKNGGIAFKELLKNSKQVEIKGIISTDSIYDRAIELYKDGIPPGNKIGNYSHDEIITWELSRLAIVTGIPTSGKSEWVDYIVCKLVRLYNWPAAFFTPENYPLEYHYSKLHEKFSGKKFNEKFNNTNFDSIFEFIKQNFHYIFNEENLTLDFILDAAKILIRKNGIKILVIDPYNTVDHQFERGQTEAQYVSKFLGKLIMFSRVYNVLIFLVAHPRNLAPGEKPTLYTISGGAHFFNKCDYGIIVNRVIDPETGFAGNQVNIEVHKVKFKHLGHQGVIEANYNYNNGRYESRIDNVDSWDNSNWLDEKANVLEDFKNGIIPSENPFEEINDGQMPF